VIGDGDLSSYADPARGQYFLVSPDKIALLVDAAGIRPRDDVVEIGAGAGTVARHFPVCGSLTVVELDERLVETLARNVPSARVVNDDALEVIRNGTFDVIVSNLPGCVTEVFIDVLSELSFRTVVMAVDQASDLSQLVPKYSVEDITEIGGSDFVPPQPTISRVVRVCRDRFAENV
jgi:16S rRNA A1518/A1519 N6-dimethyltransferase RsmA/KsgA/DIM1 with predicted DNA glycosylase/AP lyase activity